MKIFTQVEQPDGSFIRDATPEEEQASDKRYEKFRRIPAGEHIPFTEEEKEALGPVSRMSVTELLALDLTPREGPLEEWPRQTEPEPDENRIVNPARLKEEAIQMAYVLAIYDTPAAEMASKLVAKYPSLPERKLRGLAENVTGEKIEEEVPLEAVIEVPRVIPFSADRLDYLDMLADEITQGTICPFDFAREDLKLIFASCLPDGHPTFDWFPTLHLRQYVLDISSVAESGKGESWRRAKATLERSDFIQEVSAAFISGGTLGSPEFAVREFGGVKVGEGAPTRLT